MIKFTWKVKDKRGKIYTQKHVSSLKRAYHNGLIVDGDLFFQSDDTRLWTEIRDLKSFFQNFEEKNIIRKEKRIGRTILNARIYHLSFLLFIFIVLSAVIIYSGVTGNLVPMFFLTGYNLSSKTMFIAVSILILAILLFLPLTFHYLAILRWKNKIGKYFLQEDKKRKNEHLNLQIVNRLSENLSSSLEKDSLIRTILVSVINTSQFFVGFLLLHNYQLHRMIYETGLKIDRTMFKKTEFEFDDPLIKTIIRTKQIVWIEDIDNEESGCFLRSDKIPVLEKNKCRISIPLSVGEDILGIMVLYGGKKSFIQLKQNSCLTSILKNQASLALGSAIQSELAILDRLTGLLNHDYFMMRLNEEIERSRRFHLKLSLLMIDLDHFKNVNDTYGHPVGDQALKAIADMLKENIRIVDFCGRYGGEEFAIILVDTALEGAGVKAEQLRKEISEKSFIFDKNHLKLSLSIGLSSWNWEEDKELSYQDLLKRADQELYRAKKEGRNRVCFNENGKPKTLPL